MIDFPDNSFDVITACQCFWYFKHEQIMPKLHRLLKTDGRILVLYMAWLPFEDNIAGESEKLVLKYSPNWSGAGTFYQGKLEWQNESLPGNWSFSFGEQNCKLGTGTCCIIKGNCSRGV